MQKKIPELYAFTNEKLHDMEQPFIDEVAKQVIEGKEELYVAIQLFSAYGNEHSWAFRFQQVEKPDHSLVNFEIAHYYTYGSNSADMQDFLNETVNNTYSYFDFMIWFYFLKGIVFNYNNKLFMKIIEEYPKPKYYFGDKITVDEYHDAMINRYKKICSSNMGIYEEMKDYINFRRKEARQREQLGEISGYVRNPFIREYAIPITNDVVVVETPSLTDCMAGYPNEKEGPIKIYHGHKYERLF